MGKNKNKQIWVLTVEVNDYNQYGEYFCSCWDHKPDKQELFETIDEEGEWKEKVVDNLLEKGGGRIAVEEMWYSLKEVKQGVNCFQD